MPQGSSSRARAYGKVVAFLAFGIGCLGWMRLLLQGPSPGSSSPRIDVSGPSLEGLSASCLDEAISYLAISRGNPGLEDLSPGFFDSLVGILAHTMNAYGRGDFRSFCALRSSGWHAEAQSSALGPASEEIAAHLMELGEDPRPFGSGRNALLEQFWKLLYREAPPVSAFLPESCVYTVTTTGLPPSWEFASERMVGTRSTTWVEHRMTVPHPHVLEATQVLDLGIGFVSQNGTEWTLLQRFAWDAVEAEWVLLRASSVPNEESVMRQPLFLIL